MVTKTPHTIHAYAAESAADLAHFRRIPWCAALMDAEGARPYSPAFPVAPPDRAADPFLGGFMMAGRGGILRHVSMVAAGAGAGAGGLGDGLGSGGSGGGAFGAGSGFRSGSGTDDDGTTTKDTADADADAEAKDNADERRAGSEEQGKQEEGFPTHLDLYTLGPALHGIPHTVHGGVLTMLIDGSCGRVGYLHRGSGGDGGGPPQVHSYSAYTNTRFLRPCISGAADDGTVTVLVRTRICGVEEGRGAKEDEDDEKAKGGRRKGKGKGAMAILRCRVEGEGGRVYAEGESGVVENVWKGKESL